MRFIRHYEASNYGMGRPIKTIRFTADSDAEARAKAEREMPGAHGLPGSGPGAGRASTVIGVTCVRLERV